MRNNIAALPLQTRAGAPVRGVNSQARTVDVVFSTGAAVRRARWIGWDTVVPFDEILLVSPEAVDMTRINLGAPALDSHSTWSTYSQVGVTERGWIDAGNALATVRFPKAGLDAAADRMFGMVEDKIIRNVSVGYTIQRVRVIAPKKEGEIEQRIAELWTPYEISFVTVPADKDAQVRAAERLDVFPIDVVRSDGSTNGIVNLTAARARMRMRQRAL